MLYLDGTFLKGNIAYDRACPASNEASCAADFEFVVILDQSGMKSYEDGIIGLWSGNHSVVADRGLYVPWLATNGAISESVFSWYMTGLSGQSYIDFGTPDASIIGDSSAIHWVSLIGNESHWVNAITGMKWGPGMEDQGTQEHVFNSVKALTDSGSSCIIGPAQYLDVIYNGILGKTSVNVADANWRHLFFCSDIPSLPSFYLNLGGYWFVVEPEEYVVEVGSTATGQSVCAMCITSYINFNEWILGAAFMRGWYNIHDYTNKRFGFIPLPGSSKTAPELVPQPDPSNPTSSPSEPTNRITDQPAED